MLGADLLFIVLQNFSVVIPMRWEEYLPARPTW